jgi:recombination protein RecR
MEHKSDRSGLPPAVLQLVDKLAGFPGVGRKSALRMALHILRSPRETAQEMADALIGVKDRIAFCSTCWTLAEQDPCPICADQRRDHGLICVVEEPGDVIALERTGAWQGTYHVLGGALSPLDGIGPDQLRMDSLAKRVQAGGVREVVVATNPNAEGETTGLYIARLLKESGVSVTRIARGVPVGSDLELIDDSTLQAAMKGRAGMG